MSLCYCIPTSVTTATTINYKSVFNTQLKCLPLVAIMSGITLTKPTRIIPTSFTTATTINYNSVFTFGSEMSGTCITLTKPTRIIPTSVTTATTINYNGVFNTKLKVCLPLVAITSGITLTKPTCIIRTSFTTATTINYNSVFNTQLKCLPLVAIMSGITLTKPTRTVRQGELTISDAFAVHNIDDSPVYQAICPVVWGTSSCKLK